MDFDNISGFDVRLNEKMAEAGLSQAELCKRTKIQPSMISYYCSGQRFPTMMVALKIASALNTSVEYLAYGTTPDLPDYPNILPMPETYRVPLIGTIACGEPMLAVEECDETVDMPDYVRADFALRCKGDSMINARIFDGDIVYIRKQDAVDNGEIAAVYVDGDEATLKRIRRFADRIVLEPANPTVEPLVYWREDMARVRILGKAVAFTSTVR